MDIFNEVNNIFEMLFVHQSEELGMTVGGICGRRFGCGKTIMRSWLH